MFLRKKCNHFVTKLHDVVNLSAGEWEDETVAELWRWTFKP